MDLIKAAESTFTTVKEYPAFKAGDTVTVHYKIIEGNKERIQQFRGVVLQRKGTGSGATFTVRKMSGNVGVERIFPVASPFIDTIEVNKLGRVRRAKIYYLRGLTGKKARIQEKRRKITLEEPAVVVEQEVITEKQKATAEKPVATDKQEAKAEKPAVAEKSKAVAEEPEIASTEKQEADAAENTEASAVEKPKATAEESEIKAEKPETDAGKQAPGAEE
ncbi:MAG: 50S ribosomal protein L19 [Bacteroidales bacterium]|nr:50S ribosomal protein L19 [Bacteroidales bacterium]MBN2762781.1 50S ribosomal protein L19 [Bacteroidales bacterium]